MIYLEIIIKWYTYWSIIRLLNIESDILIYNDTY